MAMDVGKVLVLEMLLLLKFKLLPARIFFLRKETLVQKITGCRDGE